MKKSYWLILAGVTALAALWLFRRPKAGPVTAVGGQVIGGGGGGTNINASPIERVLAFGRGGGGGGGAGIGGLPLKDLFNLGKEGFNALKGLFTGGPVGTEQNPAPVNFGGLAKTDVNSGENTPSDISSPEYRGGIPDTSPNPNAADTNVFSEFPDFSGNAAQNELNAFGFGSGSTGGSGDQYYISPGEFSSGNFGGAGDSGGGGGGDLVPMDFGGGYYGSDTGSGNFGADTGGGSD